MFRFWRIPRITSEDKVRARQAEHDLQRLKRTRDRAEGVARHSRAIRQENHFSQAIFGGPRE